MSLFKHTSKPVRTTIAAMLIVAMLCAHWVGLIHRIMHGEGIDSISFSLRAYQPEPVAHAEKDLTSVEAAFDAQNSSGESSHDCSLFDAAALGSAVCSIPFQLVALPGARLLALWTAFASWQAPFTSHFSSRAPPRF